jgi:hypothetical protein
MSPHSPDTRAAFRTLESRLAARRLAAMDVRMRVTLCAIVVLLTGFVFWQIRVPLDGLHRHQGDLAVAKSVAMWLALWAAAAGASAAARMATMSARVPGPEWLALPLPSGAIAKHLLSEARLTALIAFPGALAVLVAAIGYMPLAWIGLGAALFVVLWLEATRWSVWAARQVAAQRAAVRREMPTTLPTTLSSMTRVLIGSGRRRPARRLPAPAWRAMSPTQALSHVDTSLTLRPTSARARMVFVALFAAASVVPWLRSMPAPEQRAFSFAAFTLACTALGAWAIARVCSDPPATLRPLPLPLGAVWRARFVPMVAGVVVLAVFDALLATHVPVVGRVGLVVTWIIPGLAIAVLGLHYAITLAPQERAAENLYFAWLGVAIAGSLMVPLMGWAVLIAGLIHSTRRLRVRHRPEVA